MSFITEWYPEFIRDKKSKEGQTAEVLGFVNKARLMALGLNKNSKLEEIPMEDAKRSKDLILFRNKNSAHPVKVWIGYTHGDTFTIYRPSEIGANDTTGSTGDKSVENRNKLYKADQAFRVNIDSREKAKIEFKKNKEDYWVPNAESSQTYKHLQKEYKNKIKEIISQTEANTIKLIDDWANNPSLIEISINTKAPSVEQMIKKYIDVISKNPTLSGVKELVSDKGEK